MRRIILLSIVFAGLFVFAGRWVKAGPDSLLTHLGSTGGSTNAIDIGEDGQYAYVAEGLGLTVMDISNPDAPVVVGRTPPFAVINKVVVSEDTVYAAVNPFGDLWVIDVSDPTAPTLLGFDDSHWIRGLSVDGPYLYTVSFGGGLHIYETSSTHMPLEVGYLQTSGFATGVDAAGELAAVADGTGGLWIVDVAIPSAPAELARVLPPSGYSVQDVALSGDYVYTEYQNTFRVFSISDPNNPVETDTVSFFSGAKVIELAGDLAFAVSGLGNVVTIDISNPADLQVLSSYESADWANDLAVTGDSLFYTDRAVGVWVLDVSDPAAPVEVGVYDTAAQMQRVVVRGDYAYVADSDEGLVVVDVSDPTFLQVVGFYKVGASDLVLDGDYVYLAAGHDGMRVVDISDPTAPTEVGAFDFPPTAGNLTYDDGYVYMVNGLGHFYIINVSDPAAPTEVASYDFAGAFHGIQVSGNLAYVMAGPGGLQVYDVSDPLAVTQVGFFDTNNRYALDVALMGDYALLTVRDYYLLVLDVSDPAQIVQVGSFDTTPLTVSVEGSLAYVAGYDDLEVLDVSNPADPTLVDSLSFPQFGNFNDVYPVNGLAYAAGSNYGLHVFATGPVLPGDEVVFLPLMLSQ